MFPKFYGIIVNFVNNRLRFLKKKMYWHRGTIFLHLILSFYSFVHAEDRLVFVNLLFRHGDRTPLNPYPKDPYKNESLWPTGFGQLTNTGKQQHFELGRWFRKRYADFLPKKYSLKDIYIRSTDVDRTLMSAESHLAGLYAPDGTDIWNPDIKWQPIPVHTVPEKSDAVLSGKKHCARYDFELKKLLDTSYFRMYNIKLKSLYKYLTNHTGKDIYDLQELEYLYNNLYIEKLYNFTLPNWTRLVFPDKMRVPAEKSFEIYCYTPILQRLKVGLLLHEIITRFINKTNNKLVPDRKMWIYSAHDTTVANVLMTLGAFDSHCPPYTSTIIFELRQSVDLTYYVNAYYKNDTTPRPISILGCEYNCSLEKLQLLLKPVLITAEEWEAECQSLSAPFVSTIAAISVVSCGALLLLLLVSLCACSKKHHNRNHFYQALSDEVH